MKDCHVSNLRMPAPRRIGAILMQKGKINIVSLALRIMNSTEKCYNTCKQELLTVVHVLEKLRIHVGGNKIFVSTDNRALIFLQK